MEPGESPPARQSDLDHRRRSRWDVEGGGAQRRHGTWREFGRDYHRRHRYNYERGIERQHCRNMNRDSDGYPDIWNAQRSIEESLETTLGTRTTTLNTGTTYGGILDNFTLIGADSIWTIRYKQWNHMLGRSDSWDVMRGHVPKYFKLNSAFYFLGAGNVDTIHSCIGILSRFIRENEGLEISLELLVDVLRNDERLSRVRRMAGGWQRGLTPWSVDGEIILVHKAVKLAYLSVSPYNIDVTFGKRFAAGSGRDHLLGHLTESKLPTDASFQLALEQMRGGFRQASLWDPHTGGQGRFFVLFHDSDLVYSESHPLPSYIGPPGNFTPYVPDP